MSGRNPSPASRPALALALSLALAACGRSAPPADAAAVHDHAHGSLFTNGDFEGGTLAGWTVTSNLNNGITVPPASLDDLHLAAGGSTSRTRVVTGGTGAVVPAGLSAAGSTLRVPRYGGAVAVVNELAYNGNGFARNVNTLQQQMTVSNADVDPADGLVHVRFAIAPVLQNPGHADEEQPYFWIQLYNVTRSAMLFQTFNFSNQSGVPWKTDAGTGTLYTDWKAFDISPGPAALQAGDLVELRVVAASCSLGGHYGHVYVDSFGPVLPGLAVTATAPQSANAGSDLTYTLTYKNSGPDAAAGVVVSQTLPAGTTFAAVGGLPAGASCTTPAAGAAGVVRCSLGAMTVGATDTFQVTVHVDAGATPGTTINNGNYQIEGTGVSPLIGPLVQTTVTSGLTYADLSATVTDGVAAVTWGQAVSYTITVANAGPNAVTGATITDTLPAQLGGATWTCSGTGGATCAASGTGGLAQTANLPVGGSVTYLLSASVVAGSGAGAILHQVTAATPAGVSDPDGSDNVGVDLDAIGNLYVLTLQKAGAGAGAVVSAPAAISCDAACSSDAASFLDGTAVVLTAVAAPGNVFSGWSGACGGSASTCSVTVTAAATATATFQPIPRTLTTSVPGGNGTLSCPSPVPNGGPATCTAAPAAGYYLSALTDNGTDVLSAVSGGSYTIASVAGDHALVATFSPAVSSLTLSTAPANPVAGQLGTATAAAAGVAPAGTPSGTVTFYSGGTAVPGCVAVPLAGGVATCTSSGPAGSYTLTAVSSGDATWPGATSNAVALTIAQASTSTGLADAPAATSVYGQPVALTAAVAVTAPGGGTPTGTVAFLDGATPLGSAALGAGGTATLTTSALAPGNHSILAVYGGDASYGSSTSPALPHAVTAAATAIALTAGPSPAVVGQPVTVHVVATALAPSGAIPQGTVEILDGATVIGTATLAADGTLDWVTSALPAGSHGLTVRLLPGAGFAGSTSATPATVLVQPAATQAAVASSLNPSSYGAPVTFTAAVSVVSPGGGVPGGQVEFRDGVTVLGTGALDGTGQATLTTSTLSAGSHPVTAAYLGSPSHAGSTSPQLVQAVAQASSSVALAASADPTVVGEPVTFTATVGSTGGTPGGNITFTAGEQALGNAALQPDGTAAITTTLLPVGTTGVVAAYQGSSDFSASSSPALPHTVQPATTEAALLASPSPSQLGQAVALTATITPVAPGAGIPGGDVTFRDGAAVLGTAALDAAGVATLSGVTQLALGDHTLSATYEGSPSYLGSSATAVQTVARGATEVEVASSHNPSRYGRPVAFTATVTSPGGTPTGTVTFLSGDEELGTGPLDGAGQATLTLRHLAKGNHPVTARYEGSAEFEQASGELAGGQVVENSPPVAGAGQALLLGEGQASSAAGEGAGALEGVRTVELWARAGWTSAGEVTGVPSLVRVGDDGAARFGLGVSPDRSALAVQQGTAGQAVAAPLTDGAWHHLALVSGAGGVTAYVDGAAAGTLLGAFDDTAGDRVVLGQGFLGELDEVRLWSTARTAEELAADARRPVAADAPGLLALWRMDDHLGGTTFDAGPAAVDLTAVLQGEPEDEDPAFGTSAAWRLRAAESGQPISPVDAGYDVDGDPLALAVTGAPAHGTATVDAEALQVGYTSAAGYAGRDLLTFQLDDGEARSSAEVELAVAVPVTCRVDADCLAGDLCVAGTCADPDGLKVRSGTGCSTGGGAGLLLGLLALALAFRRRLPALAARRAGPALSAALALAAGAARAQAPTGFQLQTYEPAPAGDRFFVVPGAEVQGHLRPAAGLVLDWAKDPLVLKQGDTIVPGGRIVKSALWAHAVGSLSLLDRVLVDVAVPVALSQDGDTPFSSLPRVTSSALGDVRLGARTPLPRLGPVALAAGLDVWLPTGKREAFSSDRALRALPKVIAGGSVGRAELGAQVGFLVRQDRDVTLTRTGSALAFSGGAAWALGALRIGPEVYGRWQFEGTATSPLEVLLGARHRLGSLDLGLAAGTAFNDAPGAAPLRLIGQLAWRPQPASAPAPAPQPEPAPEPAAEPPPPPPPPADRDGDGVIDADDACPDQAGQPSDDPARNGCPALAVVSDGKIELLQQIQFEHDRDVIRQDSLPILEEVARVLGAHPELAQVRVEGHTDSRGSVAHNTSLSDRRAKAVRRWLVEKGIDPARLSARGYGPSRPVADNATAEGRAANRRVEFHLP